MVPNRGATPADRNLENSLKWFVLIQNILNKLGFFACTQVAAWATRQGLVTATY